MKLLTILAILLSGCMSQSLVDPPAILDVQCPRNGKVFINKKLFYRTSPVVISIDTNKTELERQVKVVYTDLVIYFRKVALIPGEKVILKCFPE